MKLLFIHGPPAVGKLTIAKEISKNTNYKVFHNHLSLDLVESIFTPDKSVFWKLVSKIRLEMIKEAAKKKIEGLIFTYGPVAEDNFKFLKKVIKTVESNKGQIYLIHLLCEEKELLKRVKNKSRKKHLKTTSISKLKKSLKTWDFTTKYPHKKTIQIDTTKLSVKETTKKILSKIKL